MEWAEFTLPHDQISWSGFMSGGGEWSVHIHSRSLLGDWSPIGNVHCDTVWRLHSVSHTSPPSARLPSFNHPSLADVSSPTHTAILP